MVETDRLCARAGRRGVLHDLSIHVRRGSIYGFLGRNGAGKSTTIRVLLRLLRKTSGQVKLFGLDLDSHCGEVLPRVGSLVEAPGFYEYLSGFDNLRIAQVARGLPEISVGEALALTGLTGAARKPVGQYSTGMRQRLGLSWALLGSPPLLILDEPINGLDPAGVREVRDLLRQLRDERRATVFLSSHILSEVQQLADRVGVIHEGRLVAERDVAASGELNAAAGCAGVAPGEFAWTASSLEDYFLQVTGGAEGR